MGRLVLSHGTTSGFCTLAGIALVGGCILLLSSLFGDLLVRAEDAYEDAREQAQRLRVPWQQQWNASQWTAQSARLPPASEEMDYLRYLADRYGLTPDMPWFARRVRADYGGHPGRPSLTHVESPLLVGGGFTRQTVDSLVDDNALPIHAAVTLPMARSARPDEVDASSLLFGISTTFARLSYDNFSLPADWARWLTDGRGASNGAALVLHLHRATAAQRGQVARVLQALGIDAAVHGDSDSDGHNDTSRPADPATVRYAHLLPRLQAHDGRRRHRRRSFYALVDDDLFLPSLDKLLTRLKAAPVADRLWMGLPSDAADWVRAAASPPTTARFVTTYGGGAVVLASRLAATAASLPCLRRSADATDAAIASAMRVGGGGRAIGWDEQLYRCLVASLSSSSSSSATAAARLHILPSLYAPADAWTLQGPPDAVAALQTCGGGLPPPLALHRYRDAGADGWEFAPGAGHRVASVCGEACFLQRFVFADDWLLVNGYSLVHYPQGRRETPVSVRPVRAAVADLSPAAQQQHTFWASQNVVVEAAERPDDLRVLSPVRGRPHTWPLLDARTAADGSVWQAYVKRRENSDDEDSIVVLIWEM